MQFWLETEREAGKILENIPSTVERKLAETQPEDKTNELKMVRRKMRRICIFGDIFDPRG